MRDGYRIIDTDTHVGPGIEVLRKYASSRLLDRWDDLDPYIQQTSYGGHHLSIHPYPYQRQMGTSPAGEEAPGTGGASPLFAAVSKRSLPVPFTEGVPNENSAGRLEDMDKEGVDVNIIIPGTFSSAVSALDSELTNEIHGACNRYLAAYCDADTDRLKGTVMVSGADPEHSATVIKEFADESWAVAVSVVLPEGLPIDDPSLHPIWKALDEHDLPILQHSFFYEPPYFPGYRDVWGNVVVARAAAHPWIGQRMVAYLVLSGLLDQYPNLRLTFAECSAGWLPSWLIRLKGQADYMARALPERKHDPVDYARQGRVTAGIELYEGAGLARSVVDILGDKVLMYASDYPHPQGEFPNSPDVVFGWDLGEDVTRRIMSENAEEFFRL